MDTSRHWSDLLDRYKSGNISDADRYMLERAALDDPFLFDALEGYSTIGRSTAEKQGAKIFSLRNITVAASTIGLIAVIGYFRTVSNAEEGIVSNDNTIEAVIEPSTQPMAMKTDTPHKKEEKQEKIAKEKPQVARKRTPVAQKKEKNIQPRAIVKSEPKPSQSEQKIVLQQTNTEVRLEDKPNISGLQTSSESSYGIASDPSFSVKSQQKLRLNESINPYADKVTPPDGWEAFAKVVEEQKGAKRLKPVVVVVSFDVDTDGNISKVSTDDTFCKSCTEKAKEIIRSSSPWTNHSGKPEQITYTISF